MTASYYAAISGWYDTSEAAQRSNLLTISVMDRANVGEPLPAGATHQFYVCINATAYMVARYPNEDYRVTPHDQNEQQRQERELREAVLDHAVWYMTGEGAGYRPSQGRQAREAAIKELLEEGADQEPREETNPVPHPVIREKQPDPSISLAPGTADSPLPHPLRQWSVEIGPYNSCDVCFFGYDAEDGSPVLVPVEAEDEEPYEDDEEEDPEE
jgi:hypothetical protein